MSLDLESNQDQINVSEVNGHVWLIYEFEDFRLDQEHLMLYRNDEEIPLTPKQAETLLVLVERSHEIVSKDVLMATLWRNSVVEDSNLIQNIHFVRKVLGETVRDRPLIETFRRRGYRFNADVKRIEKNSYACAGSNRDAKAITSGSAGVPRNVGAVTRMPLAGPALEHSDVLILPGKRKSSFFRRMAVCRARRDRWLLRSC
jgi:DNA-binding winged helix-turn-helix (wHTH) protein